VGFLGETLRQARLDRGASLADAEQDTRIRRKYLEALEAEDYASLPAVVYVRGFIRAYARYLGLDPEATLDLYAPTRIRDDRPLLRSATPQLAGGRSFSLRLFTVLAGLVLIGLLLSYLWTQYNTFVDSLTQAEQRPPTRVASTPVGVAAASSPSPLSEPIAAAAQPSPEERPAQSPPSPTPIATPTATAPVAAPPERGIVVEASVTERTWMEVWTDGSSQLQATLQAGATRTFTANESVRMRVGNAGAVRVTVNGDPQGPLGERNQVKEFVWERG
jgi:cytoskeleton protein RodZ